MTANETLAQEIDQEIARFGLEDTATNCNGLVAYADDDLPSGVLRLDGDGTTSFIDAAKSLVGLRAIAKPASDFEDAQAAFYGALTYRRA
jgi:hypothetical protein